MTPKGSLVTGELSRISLGLLYLGDLHSNDFHDNDFLKTLFGVHAQVSFYFRRHCGPPRISLEAAGTSKDFVGGILSFSDFSRNPKFTKIDF